MDFGTLLQTAKENEHSNKKEIRVYNTKFAPPKKEEKKAKKLSVNIQKFLARKEAEEKQKLIESNRKRDELLALRSKDRKATRRVNVMLKRTKSANQSVIEDAVDNDNTAVTLAGPSQPDEDDYGYVSQEAAAYYNKMMEKYSKMPDDPKFPLNKKKASNNLSSTKDRVKAALEREREEALLPHKRKRKHKEELKEEEDKIESCDEEPEKIEPPPKIQKPKPAAPPPMNFNDLLKLAAQKQYEPIVIEVKPKEDEGPLLTKKQKLEYEKEQKRREAKAQNRISPANPYLPPKSVPLPSTQTNAKKSQENEKISKSVTQDLKYNEKISKSVTQDLKYNPSKPKISMPNSQNLKDQKRVNNTPTLQPPKTVKPSYEPQRKEVAKQKPPSEPPKTYVPTKKLQQKPSIPQYNPKPIKVTPNSDMQKRDPNVNGDIKDVRPKSTNPQNNIKPKQFPPKDLKPKQFPPNMQRKEFPSKPVNRKPIINKRRIIDEDEYDSEMDDFIDDDEEGEDYSKYIKDIFGYDKSKYRGMDDDDIDNMESSFAQQMREDVRSTKLGIMEDLEDIKREKEEKKRKAMMMKRKGKL